MRLATVILDWNQPILTIKTIKSVTKSILPKNIKHTIYLVENGSSEKNIDTIQKSLPKKTTTKILIQKKNLGFCQGNNLGIKKAISDKNNLICLLNNDTRVDKNMYKILIQSILKNKKIGAVSPKIYFEKGFEYHKSYNKSQLGKVIWSMGGNMDWNNVYGSNREIDKVDSPELAADILNPDFLSGCCIMLSSKTLQKVGLFDDNYYLYLEDVDLSLRIKKTGQDLLVSGKAKLWHLNSGSSGAKSDLHLYFMTRNRIYFASKFSNPRTQFAILRESIKKLMFSKEEWEKRAIKDYFLHKMGRGSWI